MDAGRYPDGASSDAADASTEDRTLADEAWPVPEQYRAEPADAAEEGGTVVLREAPPPAPAPPRRFPPPVGRSLSAALVGVLLAALLIPAGAWLLTRSADETTAATGPETTTPPPTQPTTTTEAPPAAPAAADVPDVSGQLLPDARAALEEADLRVRFERVDSEQPENVVLEQEPAAGSEAAPGSIVVLTVAGGEQRIAVPDVEGASARNAARALRDAGLGSRNRLVPADATPGTVIGQSPAAGQEVDAETVVVLHIAAARSVAVPELVGLSSSEARSRLRAVGLRFTQRPVESSRPAGEVLTQSPAAGAELRERGVVTLRVSTGPTQIEVADVVGLEEAAAARELEAAGFVVRVVDEPTIEPAEDGIVLAQSPSPGANLRKGTTVTIRVGRLG